MTKRCIPQTDMVQSARLEGLPPAAEGTLPTRRDGRAD